MVDWSSSARCCSASSCSRSTRSSILVFIGAGAIVVGLLGISASICRCGRSGCCSRCSSHRRDVHDAPADLRQAHEQAVRSARSTRDARSDASRDRKSSRPASRCRIEYRGSGWTALNVGEQADPAGGSVRASSRSTASRCASAPSLGRSPSHRVTRRTTMDQGAFLWRSSSRPWRDRRAASRRRSSCRSRAPSSSSGSASTASTLSCGLPHPRAVHRADRVSPQPEGVCDRHRRSRSASRSDNVQVGIDGVLYLQVLDPRARRTASRTTRSRSRSSRRPRCAARSARSSSTARSRSARKST